MNMTIYITFAHITLAQYTRTLTSSVFFVFCAIKMSNQNKYLLIIIIINTIITQQYKTYIIRYNCQRSIMTFFIHMPGPRIHLRENGDYCGNWNFNYFRQNIRIQLRWMYLKNLNTCKYTIMTLLCNSY